MRVFLVSSISTSHLLGHVKVWVEMRDADNLFGFKLFLYAVVPEWVPTFDLQRKFIWTMLLFSFFQTQVQPRLWSLIRRLTLQLHSHHFNTGTKGTMQHSPTGIETTTSEQWVSPLRHGLYQTRSQAKKSKQGFLKVFSQMSHLFKLMQHLCLYNLGLSENLYWYTVSLK